MKLGDIVRSTKNARLYRIVGRRSDKAVQCQALRPDEGPWDRSEVAFSTKELEVVTEAQASGNTLENRFS